MPPTLNPQRDKIVAYCHDYASTHNFPLLFPEPETRRQEIFNYICVFGHRFKSTPNRRIIAQAFRLSYTTIYAHVKELEADGLIEIDGEYGIIEVVGSWWGLGYEVEIEPHP